MIVVVSMILDEDADNGCHGSEEADRMVVASRKNDAHQQRTIESVVDAGSWTDFFHTTTANDERRNE